MTIGELMNTCVVECTEDTSIEEAYELLGKCDHRVVVVVDSRAHRRPIGVLTDRSICEQVIGRGRNPRSLAAGSAMETRIVKVLENEPIANIAIANPDEIAAIVVVNDRRQVRGVVPKERLAELGPSFATTNSSSRIFVNTTPRVSPAISEIPGFGWVQ
jgi:CBS domain-containing protein